MRSLRRPSAAVYLMKAGRWWRTASARVSKTVASGAAKVVGGKLPEKLSDVKVVPVPDDPGTGRPFEYRREGDRATLTSRIPGEPPRTTGLRFRIELRKQ